MTEAEDNVVEFPAVRQPPDEGPARRAAAAVNRAGVIPEAEATKAPDQRRPQRAAITTFVALAVVALVVAALYPGGPDGSLRWQTAFAFVVAILMGSAAIIWRFVHEFWR